MQLEELYCPKGCQPEYFLEKKEETVWDRVRPDGEYITEDFAKTRTSDEYECPECDGPAYWRDPLPPPDDTTFWQVRNAIAPPIPESLADEDWFNDPNNPMSHWHY